MKKIEDLHGAPFDKLRAGSEGAPLQNRRNQRFSAAGKGAQKRVRSGVAALVPAISKAIRQIPRGRVSTYGAIAKAAGYPRCARHVAKVLNQVDGLPWQRVVGSGGRISLRGELAMEQRFLLEAEGVRFRGRRVDMKAFEHRFKRMAGKSLAPTAKKRRVPQK